MSTIAHIHQLQQKHDALKTAIKDEMKHLHHSENNLLSMKKQKLQLKDEILMLRRQAA